MGDTMRFPMNHLPTPNEMPEVESKVNEFLYKFHTLKLRDAMLSDKERTSPDTYGCDCIFLDHFVTDEMEDDFSLIARDFFLHEYINLEEYDRIIYLDPDTGDDWPDRVFQKHVLNLMMNAANGGSEYARNLFVYLHKTYYRKEYKQLKRFNTLSMGELAALAETPKGVSPVDMARILSISRMYKIEIRRDCHILYLLLDDFYRESYQGLDWSFADGVTELYEECFEAVQEKFEDEDEMYGLYEKCDKFMGNALRSMGYAEDYVHLCDDSSRGLPQILGRTLAVLRKTYRSRDFSKEELILYAAVYQAVSALTCNADITSDRLKEMLHGEEGTDFYDCFPPMFHADEVMKGKQSVKAPKDKSAGNNTVVNDTVSKEEPQYKEEDLLAEIDSLRRKLHQQEGEIRQLRNDLADRRKLQEENRQLHGKLAGEHSELVALREHVYSLTEQDDVKDSVSIEEMKEFLKTLRIVIVGGHRNWISKVKQVFPDWIYVNPEVSGALESSVVDRADYVYFFTDIMSHSTYFKYINAVRGRETAFGYIHGVNIENNIRQMYRELKK